MKEFVKNLLVHEYLGSKLPDSRAFHTFIKFLQKETDSQVLTLADDVYLSLLYPEGVYNSVDIQAALPVALIWSLENINCTEIGSGLPTLAWEPPLTFSDAA